MPTGWLFGALLVLAGVDLHRERRARARVRAWARTQGGEAVAVHRVRAPGGLWARARTLERASHYDVTLLMDGRADSPRAQVRVPGLLGRGRTPVVVSWIQA